MSTFRGAIKEFPDIFVDYFRLAPEAKPPRACFLSHVHSDHLIGLDNYKGSFIYCSAVTKALLIKLEKQTHRLNFANNIVEHRKTTYKFQEPRLKPIPLETPTKIELELGNVIQVTLFDANHCSGAVMFLFEQDSKAVLYTGDIRSEPWFVNNLIKNPFLIEYTSGMKTLDCIYLDTSNLDPIKFPTKAEGLRELISKIKNYPNDTIFHIAAWTFGYEEVWLALSKTLGSQIHLDDYKLLMYHSLPVSSSGTVLREYKVGNATAPSFLTNNPKVRLHSCEKGTKCSGIDKHTVFIRPIITRLDNGEEIGEIGVGEGGGDLQHHSELDITGLDFGKFMNLFSSMDDGAVKAELTAKFLKSVTSGQNVLALNNIKLKNKDDGLSIGQVISSLARSAMKDTAGIDTQDQPEKSNDSHDLLPKVITFPYSRHSSYEELCSLVRTFQPKDVYPCTVNEEYWWNTGKCIQTLFGKECSADNFRYDFELADWQNRQPPPTDSSNYSQATTKRTQESPRSPLLGNQQNVARHESPSSRLQLGEFAYASSVLTANESTSTNKGLRVTDDTAIISKSYSGVDQQALLPLSVSKDNQFQILSVDVETGESVSGMALKASGSIVVQYNSEGQPRPFDRDGNEIFLEGLAKRSPVAAQNHTRTMSDGSYVSLQETPPQNFIAESPGSASQNFRKETILRDLEVDDRSQKRTRLTYHGSDSIPSMISSDNQNIASSQDISHISDSTQFANPAMLAAESVVAPLTAQHDLHMSKRKRTASEAPLSQHRQMVNALNTRSIFLQTDQIRQTELQRKKEDRVGDQAALTSVMDEDGYAEESELPTSFDEFAATPNSAIYESEDDAADDKPEIFAEQDYFDSIDGVFRCGGCDHELWTADGVCTYPFCLESLKEDAYYEIGSEDEDTEVVGPRPLRIAANEYDEEIGDEAVAQELAGDYLDNDPEAYDSQDSSKPFEEEYDMTDSLIDDTPQYETDSEPSESDDDDNSDGETDYKARYKNLLAIEVKQRQELEELRQKHNRLAQNYNEMEISFADWKDAMGVETDSEDVLEAELDEDGNVIIDVEPHDIEMAEILVSSASSSQDSSKEIVMKQAAEQSQNSVLDTQRIEDRIAGFKAAENGTWNELSLMSTGGNHTNLEEEL